MPELPEVETTVRGISETSLNKKIVDIWSDQPSLIKNKTFNLFKKSLIGLTFKKAERKGKNIIVELSDSSFLLMHMKMTGHFMYGEYVYTKKTAVPKDLFSELNDKYNKYIHLSFIFENGFSLVFCDVRKFGTVNHFKNKEEILNKLDKLGPEPLDENFTPILLKERLLTKIKSKIKPTLLDQSILVGVGNIYADEALFLSKIHPERTIDSLKESDFKNLHKSLLQAFSKGLLNGGDSMSDYRNIYGEKGKNQNSHEVYQRKGLLCKRKNCNSKIERKMVAGRGTYFCGNCQKLIVK